MNQRKKLMVCLLLLGLFLFPAGTGGKVDAAGGYTIYVNRKTNIVNVVNRSGKLVRAMYCSTGRNYATIRGTFHTQNKMRWHALFHGVYGKYCTRIQGSYLFHSVWYYKPASNQLSYKEFNKLGTQASAGCVRLAVVDSKWIYDHCPRGTKVVIGESRVLKKPTRPKIKLPSGRGWDPTDPDPANPYRPKIALKKGVSRKISYGSTFNPADYVNVASKVTAKKKLIRCLSVSGKVQTKKPGRYTVTITVTDPATLLTRSVKTSFVVGRKPAAKTEEDSKDTAGKETEQDSTEK